MFLDPKKLKVMVVMGNAALTKALLMIGLGWGGYKLDQKWGMKPWFMFLGVLVGLGLGLWYIIFLANRFNRSQGSDSD
ncbi:MAG: ATPase [Proteobacteria bacterium]|nr:ATPase [Pseudomonadota bacterium]NDD05005.1 ATPase [Pseudomonadota bacterium]NDG26037.1 ATPase [Pseudomonadota bacterium]